jgi:AcrR family transcriptional regulator
LRSLSRTHPSRDDRRDEIRGSLSQAVERLLESGESYSELSVGRLCEVTGISRATFYQYFDGKGDLLSQLAEAMLRDVAEGEFWWQLPADSDGEALRGSFGQMFDMYREHRAVMRSLSEAAAHDAAMDARLRAIVGWGIDRTAAFIQAGIDAGGISSDIDPRPTAEWLCWMFERGLYHIADDVDEEQLDGMLTAITRLLENALAPDVA